MIFQYQNINWRDRPNQWGNFDYVQGNMFDRAAKIGIDPYKLKVATLLWEHAGDKIHNYADKNNYAVKVGNAIWTNTGLDFVSTGYAQFQQVPITENKYSILSWGSLTGDLADTILVGIAYDGDTDQYISLGGKVDNYFVFYFRNNTTTWITAGTPIEGKEYFLSAVCRSSSDRELYIDGKLSGVSTTAVTFPINVNYCHLGLTLDSTPSGYKGTNSQTIISIEDFTSDQIAFLSDNLYYLYQPYSPVFYSFPITAGNLSRYHNLNGLGGQGTMTWNPLG